jgi:hypothetical protein
VFGFPDREDMIRSRLVEGEFADSLTWFSAQNEKFRYSFTDIFGNANKKGSNYQDQ